MNTKVSARVMVRIFEAECRTEVAIEQQDYRIAWVTVRRAAQSVSDPWRAAFFEIVGNVPEIAIPFWQCRADLMQDEYVPLNRLQLRYTKEWGEDYIAAKLAADDARAAYSQTGVRRIKRICVPNAAA